MKRNHIIASVGVFLAVVVAADAAYARPIEILRIEGSRAQVRAACVGGGMALYEATYATTCINENKGIGVSCGDDGKCVASGNISQRISGGGIRVTPKAVLGASGAVKATPAVPQSLSEPTEGGAGAMVPTNPSPPPAPPSYPDIIM